MVTRSQRRLAPGGGGSAAAPSTTARGPSARGAGGSAASQVVLWQPAGVTAKIWHMVPEVEFELDAKLEAKDPRSQSNCIATVVGKTGCRIRLRLDGSDSKNDFWRLVDSEDLHPIGYTEGQGQMLQPPVGFTLNAIHWPKFYAKTLAGAKCAKEFWFKPVPQKPEKNI